MDHEGYWPRVPLELRESDNAASNQIHSQAHHQCDKSNGKSQENSEPTPLKRAKDTAKNADKN